jgi:hypothetical protein
LANLAHNSMGTRSYVSSIAYSNHHTRINDGVFANGEDTTIENAWSSAAEQLPQWAAVVFPRFGRVEQVTVHWGKVGDYMTSRSCRIQGWRDGKWDEIAQKDALTPEHNTRFTFDAVVMEAVRVWQNSGCGPEEVPGRMWIAEIEAEGEFVGDVNVDHRRIRDALEDEWEQNYWEARSPITRRVLACIDGTEKKSGGTGPIGPAEITKARRNADQTGWGKKQADRILADASWWLQKSDDFIYDMIPPGNPRAISPSYERGCPIHGGGRKCMQTNTALSYKWQCVIGGEWWFNGAMVKNPSTGEMVEVCDEGDGWAAPEGFANPGTVYHFHSAWRYYVLSKLFFHPYEPTIESEDAYTGHTAIIQLPLAYALTGDERFAHKAAVMLNRLAEVYRYYNGTVDEQRPLTRGYLVQVSWEEMPIFDCLVAYDVLMETMESDASLLEFFKTKGDCDYNGDGTVDSRDIRHNIQHNLFGYMYEWLHRAMAIQTGDYIIREGLVLWALGSVFGNQALIDEAIEGRYGLAVNLTNNTFRDGKWWYDSPGYSIGCVTQVILERMLAMKGTDFIDDPRLRIRETIRFARDVFCDGRIPSIGDTGMADSQLKIQDVLANCGTEELAFLHTGDESSKRSLLAVSDGDVDRIRECYADERLLFNADEIRGNSGPLVPRTRIFHDSGIAILRTGEELATRKHLVLNYGKGNSGHGHKDKLGINLIAFGFDLAADLGYPTTFTHPKVEGWEKHTASHATVLIDGTNQEFASGSLEVYGKSPGMQVVSASGKRAYPGLAETYERTLWLVDASHSNHYIFDVFRVAGGKQHDYVFRSYSGEKGENFSLDLPSGVESVLQEGGSAAGQDVCFSKAPGLGYMRDVSVAACNGQWSANWRMGNEDETGIRLTMLGANGREILTAKGEGYGFFGQSPLDACVLARDRGGNSVFVSILEPYQGDPFVKSVEQLELAGAVGAKVNLEDREDILLQRIESSGVCRGEVDGVSVAFDAQFVRVTTRENGAAELHLIDGCFLKFGEYRLDAPTSLRGEVMSADPVDNSVVLHVSEGGMPESGDTIIFRNASYICNSSYEVTGVTAFAEGKCEVVLDMTMVLSQGSVADVDMDSGVFSTQTCMTKLEVCPGLFDGKIIWAKGEPLGALEVAGPNMEEFAEKAYISGIQSDAQEPTQANFFKFASAGSVHGLKTGDRFSVCDLAAGDTFKVVRSAFRTCDCS